MNIEINGVTLNVDFMDAGFMEVFEPALYRVQDQIKTCKNMKGSVAASYKAINDCIEGFFDESFGEETSEQIFQGGKNVMVHMQALERIVEAQKEERKLFNDFSNKYTQRQQQNGFNSMQGHQKNQNRQNNRP